MNFCLALTNLLLVGFVAVTDGNKYQAMVRDQLEDSLTPDGVVVEEEPKHALRPGRDLKKLQVDFERFEGEWFDCMHTTLMTFDGTPAEKHKVNQVGCDLGLFGTVAKMDEDNTQTLIMNVDILNHCFLHGLGGEGQEPCPNDELPNDKREGGNVLVRYAMKGIGSFSNDKSIQFFSDHTLMKDKDGNWKPANMDRARNENKDTMDCIKYMKGIVCDWKINEYRAGMRYSEGCVFTEEVKPIRDGGGQMGGEEICKINIKKATCDRRESRGQPYKWKGGVCNPVKVDDAFVYDSFGSYYLVNEPTKCGCVAVTDPPVATPSTQSPSTQSPQNTNVGCYGGGQCEGINGCCDCTITTEEDCKDGIFYSNGECDPICKT